jgi:tetratricopeptide (TPR) repeat protein
MGSISEAITRLVKDSRRHQGAVDQTSETERTGATSVKEEVVVPGLIELLAREGGYRALKLGVSKLVRSGGLLHYRSAVLSLQAELLWSHGKHAEVRQIAERLVTDFRSSLGYFYLAQSAFIHGDVEEAIVYLRDLIALDPIHTDGIYLMVACAVEAGDRERAWKLLEGISLRDSRAKTWLHMANLVQTVEDFSRMSDARERAVQKKVIPPFGREIAGHLAQGALLCGDFELAKSIWRETTLRIISKPAKSVRRTRKRVDYSPGRAERALVDLKRSLENSRIEMFLVSGTLLGCVREGRLLGHDKDIDVGIWNDVPAEAIRAAVRQSGCFFFIPSRSPDILRVRHVNGIPLDLFYHYREPADYWHGGIKMKWHNSPFELERKSFLSESFLIPCNHELYLEENYGDWRTPKMDFDSAFDTPNGEVTQSDEMLIHSFRMLLECYLKGASSKVEYYLGKIERLGESEFCAKCRTRMGVLEQTAGKSS